MCDIRTDLGLEEMDDPNDDDMSGGSQCLGQSIDEESGQPSGGIGSDGDSSDSDSSAANVVPRCKRRMKGFQEGGLIHPSQTKKHSMASERTQGNIQYWFGSAAV